jgi:hypothetical protein
LAALEVNAPILADKHHAAPSAFTPENLLREARRQKGLRPAAVPPVCVLDPMATLCAGWSPTARRASPNKNAVARPRPAADQPALAAASTGSPAARHSG